MTKPAPEETNNGAMPQDMGIPIPIEWHIPESVATRYTTNYVVQHTEHEFVLSFFEIQPPILLGPHEEVRAAAENIESIRATCVARVVIASERMPDLIRILQENLKQYRSRPGQEESDD